MAAEQLLYVHIRSVFLLHRLTNIVSTIITFLLPLASQEDKTPLRFHLASSSGFVSRFVGRTHIIVRLQK